MINGTLTLVRGDDQDVGVTVTNPDSTPYILSGCALTFTAQQSAANATPILSLGANIYDPENGLAKFTFIPSDTTNIDDQSHAFTIRLSSSGGKITTLMNGCFTVVPGAISC